jgi:hypothetical protein
MVPWYGRVYVQIKHYLKNNLKYKHSGAKGKLVGVVSRNGITVYYNSNWTAMSAARISTTLLTYVRTYTCTNIN